MKKEILIEFINAGILILTGLITLILPLFNVVNVKNVFLFIIAVSGVINLIKNMMIIETKDYSGFYSAIASLVVLILMMFLNVNEKPWNLAMILFIWIIIMSLVKLKQGDYYHDRRNKLWKAHILILVLFVIIGIVTSINLYYSADIQILVLGFFFTINGILEIINPLIRCLKK